MPSNRVVVIVYAWHSCRKFAHNNQKCAPTKIAGPSVTGIQYSIKYTIYKATSVWMPPNNDQMIYGWDITQNITIISHTIEPLVLSPFFVCVCVSCVFCFAITSAVRSSRTRAHHQQHIIASRTSRVARASLLIHRCAHNTHKYTHTKGLNKNTKLSQ